MSWSANFISKMSSRRCRPRFLLETVDGSDFEPGVGTVGLSSHLMAGYTQALTSVGNSMGAGRLQIGDWSHTTSELTLGFRGSVDIRRSVARGLLMQLRVGFPGWPAGDYEPVFYGHVQSIDRSGDDWTITLRSVVASLVSRMTQDVDDTALFSSLGTSTLNTAYVDGVSTVIQVASAAAAEKEGGAGGAYLLQVYPDTGDPFFVIADVLDTTPVGYDEFQTLTTGILGTVSASASMGAQVKFCAYIKDSPTRAARRVLMSTGSGLNGLYDTLPFSWGVGIPQHLIDDDDCDRTKAIAQPTGFASSKWYVYSVETQDDGLSWLQGVLGPAGLVLCERQGQLTIRAVSPPYQAQYDTKIVNDTDIQRIDIHQTWDTSTPVEFAYFLITAAASTFGTAVGEDLDSRPPVLGTWSSTTSATTRATGRMRSPIASRRGRRDSRRCSRSRASGCASRSSPRATASR